MTERQKLKRKADDIFRHIIYKRDGKVCQLAGKDNVTCGGGIQCAHIISRGNFRLRWEPMNAVCLCAGHHVYYTHKEYLWWDIVKQHFPEHWKFVEPLRTKLGSTKKADLNLVILKLQQIYEELR